MPGSTAPVFTEEDINLLLQNLDQLGEDEIKELHGLVEDLVERRRIERLRDDLIAFCCHMQDDYKVGNHHRRLAALLEDIEALRKDRICVSVPPRHGKSQLVSIYYAAWYLGRNPTHKVMLVSHTTDLAVDFGRKIRNLIASDRYREVFPDVTLATDSKSAGRWNTNHGGEFFAAGVGAALAGRGAHLLLVDDPHSEQDVLAGNFEVFKKAYEWFTYGARTRLMPGGRVAIVHCMTGDTGVLRPDGTETPLRDIRPGDMIASYKNGALVHRKVLNWANQGPDQVYAIETTSSILRANARHPFLVVRDGVETWVKVQDLKVGDSVVSLKGATTSARQKQNQAPAKPAAVGRHTTKSTRVGRNGPWGIGVSTQIHNAVSKGVATLRRLMECATSTTHEPRMPVGGGGVVPKVIGTHTLSTAMVSRLRSTTACWTNKGANALFAESPLTQGTYLQIGRVSWPWTTATDPAASAPSCATSATSWLGLEPTRSDCRKVFSTSEIISIRPDGVEDVFDIQVEDTENFIANGVCSHNTRWHMDDLIGRVISDMAKNEGADQYEVFEFPAILEIKQTDPETGAETIVEKALWPEFFDLPALRRTKASMPVFQWNAQYQQRPTAEEGAVIKREWWRQWGDESPPQCEYIITTLDAAAEANNRADFTSITTWGVFFNEAENTHQIILLAAIKERLEFPDLKRVALKEYQTWEPDAFIVEKKSSGTALYQEMRRMGIPVQEYTPVRGSVGNPNNKQARLNSVADILASGMVWAPDRRWAEELIEEVAAFPFGSHDDQVDTTIMALLRFRQGGFIALPSDARDDDEDLALPTKADYY